MTNYIKTDIFLERDLIFFLSASLSQRKSQKWLAQIAKQRNGHSLFAPKEIARVRVIEKGSRREEKVHTVQNMWRGDDECRHKNKIEGDERMNIIESATAIATASATYPPLIKHWTDHCHWPIDNAERKFRPSSGFAFFYFFIWIFSRSFCFELVFCLKWITRLEKKYW